MGPATESVMGSVPEEKSGIAAVSGLPESRLAAEDSIDQANGVAETLPADDAASLVEAAAGAFTEALGIGLTVAAACALVAAVVVKRWLPLGHTTEGRVFELPEAGRADRLAA
jgi:hypothetical protein